MADLESMLEECEQIYIDPEDECTDCTSRKLGEIASAICVGNKVFEEKFTADVTKVEVVQELPTEPDYNTLYLLATGDEAPCSYEAYMWVNGDWEKIGGGTNLEEILDAIEDLKENKQDKLKAGNNITISDDNVISATGGGGESDPTFTMNDVYPVGSLYMSTNGTSPETLFGGTWERLEDRFILASGNTYSEGETGGSANATVVSHTHTQAAHRHAPGGGESYGFASYKVGSGIARTRAKVDSSGRWTFMNTGSSAANSGLEFWRHTNYVTPTINSAGSSGVGKNMPPYIAVNVWKRLTLADNPPMAVTGSGGGGSMTKAEILTALNYHEIEVSMTDEDDETNTWTMLASGAGGQETPPRFVTYEEFNEAIEKLSYEETTETYGTLTWTIRKYGDGRLEATGIKTGATTGTMTSASYGGYSAEWTEKMPSELTKIESFNHDLSVNAGYLINAVLSNVTLTEIKGFYLMFSSSTAATDMTMYYEVKGRWD